MRNCVRGWSLSLLPILLLAASPLRAELLSVGVTGGVPLTDAFKTASSGSLSFFSDTKPYVAGPTVEFHLPFGLGIEFDALYRRLNYESSGVVNGTPVATRTTANAWEFPLLLKLRTSPGFIAPFIDGGVSFRRLSDLKQIGDFFGETDRPPELENRTAAGFVIGAGLEFRAAGVRISPQVRYTRWGAKHFRDVSGLLSSNEDQADFLVGITF